MWTLMCVQSQSLRSKWTVGPIIHPTPRHTLVHYYRWLTTFRWSLMHSDKTAGQKTRNEMHVISRTQLDRSWMSWPSHSLPVCFCTAGNQSWDPTTTQHTHTHRQSVRLNCGCRAGPSQRDAAWCTLCAVWARVRGKKNLTFGFI